MGRVWSGWTYAGPEGGLVYWLAVDDVLGDGDVEGVALVLALAVCVERQLYFALFWRCEGKEGGAGECAGGESDRDGQLEARHGGVLWRWTVDGGRRYIYRRRVDSYRRERPRGHPRPGSAHMTQRAPSTSYLL